MLESAEHWKDVGYDVETGKLEEGQKVVVVRPDRNSPLTIPTIDGEKLIDWRSLDSIDSEIDWVCGGVKHFLSGGLQPEELLIIALDDRHARSYLAAISKRLVESGVATNNVIADPYNEPPFSLQGRVTLSTVYRAKGNEASCVFAIGVDAINLKTRVGRNKIFTAFTRTKAWLRVSGVGDRAKELGGELSMAVDNAPRIQFVMPNLKAIETIQRGFSKKAVKAKAAREKFIRELRTIGLSDDEIEMELALGPPHEK